MAAPADDAVVVEVEAATLGDPRRAGPGAAGVPGLGAVGRVVAVGAGATHLDGARVVVGAAQACGECDVCRRGGVTVCPAGRTLGIDAPGTLAERITARARWVLPLRGELDGAAVAGAAAALLGHEAALAYALYARAGVGPRDPTIVIGDDAVARLLADVLIAKSAPPIMITGEPALAARAGERDLAVVGPDDGVEAVRAAAEARGHGARPWKLFATDPRAAHRALALAGPRATVAIAAPYGLDTVDAAPALAREATITGVRGAHPDLLPELAALAIRGELDLAGAAEIIARADLDAALARPRRGRALVVALS